MVLDVFFIYDNCIVVFGTCNFLWVDYDVGHECQGYEREKGVAVGTITAKNEVQSLGSGTCMAPRWKGFMQTRQVNVGNVQVFAKPV